MIPKLQHYKDKWHVASDSSIKPGLDSIKEALKLLGNPEETLQVIHVAGTNGKGSTIAFLDELARKHGLTVGKFMSPCIVDVHDQIQINQCPIPEEKLDAIFRLFAQKGISGLLTDFELLTCAAFVYFSTSDVDVVLIETGMGGTFDSTNVVNPVVSVITSIALEHTNFLGNTTTEIATHKAGIIKLERPVVIGRLEKEAMEVVEQKARLEQAPLLSYGDSFLVKHDDKKECYVNVQRDFSIDALERKLLGDHQRINMAIAITAFVEFAANRNIKVQQAFVREAIMYATLAGRFEEVYPNVFFEGAHNPASIKALVDIVNTHFPNKSIELYIGMLRDKDVEAVLALLEPIVSKIGFLSISNERALSAEAFFKLSQHPNKEIVEDALEAVMAPVPNNTIRIVTGSLYLLADLREKMRKMTK